MRIGYMQILCYFVYRTRAFLDFVIHMVLERVPCGCQETTVYTKVPSASQKFSVFSTLLLGNTYISTCFHNRKKSKEDFHFYKKRWKSKIIFSIYFANEE